MSDSTPSAAINLSTDELKFIQDAAEYLENPSFLMRLAEMFGKPLEWLIQGVEKISPDIVDKVSECRIKGRSIRGNRDDSVSQLVEVPGFNEHRGDWV